MSNTSPDTSLDLGSPSQEQQQRQQHEEGSPSALHDSSILTQSSIDLHDDTADTSGLGTPSEKHPKGKRKRTATKDKMILEEAYLRNPKPDKQARLDVVQRVSLNEKEVQVCSISPYRGSLVKRRAALRVVRAAHGRVKFIFADQSTPVTCRSGSRTDDRMIVASHVPCLPKRLRLYASATATACRPTPSPHTTSTMPPTPACLALTRLRPLPP
jgi:hypothetical protein